MTIDNTITQVLWNRNFLAAQGIYIPTMTIYQDYKRTLLLAENGYRSKKHVVRHPFPLPSIQETIRTMTNFTYCTNLDKNMGYWTIPMCPESQRICTIILPWGKFFIYTPSYGTGSITRCPSCSLI